MSWLLIVLYITSGLYFYNYEKYDQLIILCLLIMTLYFSSNLNENMTSTEAVTDLASMYNSNNVTSTNIIASNDITATNNISGKNITASSITTDNLAVTGAIKVGNLTISGDKISSSYDLQLTNANNYTLILQTDNNLVYYSPTGVVWAP